MPGRRGWPVGHIAPIVDIRRFRATAIGATMALATDRRRVVPTAHGALRETDVVGGGEGSAHRLTPLALPPLSSVLLS